MATSNIFSGTIASRTLPGISPGLTRFTSTGALVATGAFTAAQALNGFLTMTAGAPATATTPTAVALGALLYNQVAVGDTFEFVLQTGDANVCTIAMGAGMTLVGLATTGAAAGSSAAFWVRCTAIPTDAAGTGATFSWIRKS
jgi:hypothetical protein